MSDFPHSALEEFKTQAAILFKQLHAHDRSIAQQATLRLQRLDLFEHLSVEAIIQSEHVQLKHALNAIAQENDYASWADFKKYLERKALLAKRRDQYYTRFYPRRCARFVLEWHADYAIASTELGRSEGYLFPYKNQFFICSAECIITLGLDPDDPDWKRMGYNWVEPADEEARARLDTKLTEFEKTLA